MASTPQFIAAPQTWSASLTTANPNRDGTGTLVPLAPGAAAPGSRIDKIRIQAAGTTTVGVIRYFLFDGSTNRLIKERLVAAITPGAGLAAFEDEWTPIGGIILPNVSWSLRVATHNAENFNVFADGGNFN
jgi:hypothetical protein